MAVRTSINLAHAPKMGLLDRLGPGDFAIPFFIFTTVALEEGHVLNAVSRLILVGVFILDLLSGRRLTINPFLLTAGLFFAVSAASLTWTISPESSSARVMSFAYQFVSYIALMNLVSWRRRRVELCLSWVVFGALWAGVQVILIQGVTFQDTRSVAGVIPPGQLALACAAGIAISIYRFSSVRQSRYLAAIAALSLFLTMTSGRRGLMIATFFVVAFFFLGRKRIGGKVGALVVGATALIGVYMLVMYNTFLYTQVGYRIESFIGFASGDSSGDASVQGRSSLIDFGFSIFQQSPLLGQGIDSFRDQFQFIGGSWETSADNNYVEILADLGIVGFLAYYVPLAIFLVCALRGISRKGADVVFAVSFVLSMTLLDFSNVWFFSKVGMLMMALCYMVVYQSRIAERDADDSILTAKKLMR